MKLEISQSFSSSPEAITEVSKPLKISQPYYVLTQDDARKIA